MCNYNYWASRYGFVRDETGNKVRYVPRLAQRIFDDILAEMEAEGVELILQFLKARRLGISTEAQLRLCHRVLFYPDTQIVMFSDNPKKSDKLSKMLFLAWDNQPWWLRPPMERYKRGFYYEFTNGNRIDLEHGSQESDIGRGDNPNCGHGTEMAKVENPESLIDAGLLKAVIPNPYVFFIFEGTAEGDEGWWYDKYWFNKHNYGHPGKGARMRPTFLPWPTGVEIYPTYTWLKTNRWNTIKETWQPQPDTIKHAQLCENYIRTSPHISKHMGKNWSMSKEQQYFYECSLVEYRYNNTIHVWQQEMACVTGDTRIGTEQGIIRIEDARSVQETETGSIAKWHSNGVRPVMKLRTKLGRELTATYDHQFLLGDGSWRETQNLQKGDLLTLSKPKFAESYHKLEWQWFPDCKVTLTIDEQWGRFLGYFMGDGCFSSKDTVAISCDRKDVDIALEVEALLSALTGKVTRHEKRKGMLLFRSSNVKWKEVLHQLSVIVPRYHPNLGRNCGWKRKVCVPEAIWRSPRSVVKEFVSALFECDGHAQRQYVSASLFSAHEEFLRDVQLLLTGFHINSAIKVEDKIVKAQDGRASRCYIGRSLKLRAEDAIKFYREIGFRSIRKQTSGKKIIKNHWRTTQLPWSDEVESVKMAGEQEVYDLTIPSTRSQGTNGLLTHNSDDVSCFASREISVFDAELRLKYRQACPNPIKVYGIRKGGIPEKFWPQSKEFKLDNFGKPIIKKVIADWNPRLPPLEFEFVELKFNGYSETDPFGKLFIWEEPEDGEVYAFGADVADGLGAYYSDNTVLEGFRKGGREKLDAQVCEFATPDMSGADLWLIGMAVGTYYSVYRNGVIRQPRFVPEINREGGQTFLREMERRGWRNFHEEVRPSSTRRGIPDVHKGWRMNPVNREDLVQKGIQAIREEFIEINSPWLVSEMDVLIKHNDGKIAAAKKKHDDRLICLWLPFVSTYYDEARSTGRNPFLERIKFTEPSEQYAVYRNPQSGENAPQMWHEGKHREMEEYIQ